MALSEVNICNRACDLVGVDPITSLEDNSQAARVMKRNYEQVRDMTLAAYPWNCAMRVASLGAVSEVPSWGYARYFPLPEGPNPEYCLRVYRTEYEALSGRDDYKIMGRKIASNATSPLKILYIARITDPALFSPLLAEAIAAGVAVFAGAGVVDAATRIEVARNYRNDILKDARSADAQEGTPDDIVANHFITARY